MRKLRQTLIPNTRSWDSADLALQGTPVEKQKLEDVVVNPSSQPNFGVSPSDNALAIPIGTIDEFTGQDLSSRELFHRSLVTAEPRTIAKVSFWSNKLIQIDEQKLAAKITENSILLRNLDEPTELECRLYAEILSNNKFIAFRNRHLGIVDLVSDTTDMPALKGSDDLTRTIERFISKSKARLLQYGFVIAVNPANIFPIALQQSSYSSKLICVYTPDFEGSVDRDCIEKADRIICAAETAAALKDFDVAGIDIFDQPEQMLESVTSCIQSFSPKQFNMLMPVWNGFERIENIDRMALTARDLVLKLKCSESDAPSVTGSFSEYIESVSKECTAILASEGLCERYVSLIEKLDDKATRASFLKRALNDGARCEFIYA